jgi:putative transposase
MKKKKKSTRKTRRNIKKRMDKINFKIKNLIHDMHNQTASWLSQSFGKILLPTFGTSKMQQGTTLGSTTKRKLQCLSHYSFQQKLKWMCHKNGSKLFLVEEHFTTKTCGNCGMINNEIGSNKTFSCGHCRCIIDRDINGARNIYIKTMTEHGIKK